MKLIKQQNYSQISKVMLSDILSYQRSISNKNLKIKQNYVLLVNKFVQIQAFSLNDSKILKLNEKLVIFTLKKSILLIKQTIIIQQSNRRNKMLNMFAKNRLKLNKIKQLSKESKKNQNKGVNHSTGKQNLKKTSCDGQNHPSVTNKKINNQFIRSRSITTHGRLILPKEDAKIKLSPSNTLSNLNQLQLNNNQTKDFLKILQGFEKLNLCKFDEINTLIIPYNNLYELIQQILIDGAIASLNNIKLLDQSMMNSKLMQQLPSKYISTIHITQSCQTQPLSVMNKLKLHSLQSYNNIKWLSELPNLVTSNKCIEAIEIQDLKIYSSRIQAYICQILKQNKKNKEQLQIQSIQIQQLSERCNNLRLLNANLQQENIKKQEMMCYRQQRLSRFNKQIQNLNGFLMGQKNVILQRQVKAYKQLQHEIFDHASELQVFGYNRNIYDYYQRVDVVRRDLSHIIYDYKNQIRSELTSTQLREMTADTIHQLYLNIIKSIEGILINKTKSINRYVDYMERWAVLTNGKREYLAQTHQQFAYLTAQLKKELSVIEDLIKNNSNRDLLIWKAQVVRNLYEKIEVNYKYSVSFN